MPKIHMILQGKGGSAKTTTAAIIAQYLKDHDKNPTCIDTDPVNASFSSYKNLNVKQLKIISDGIINIRAWDSLMEILCRTKTDVVVDNGATSFISLLSYIGEDGYGNAGIQMCKNFKQEVYIHIPIIAGEGLLHCLTGMRQIIEKLSSQMPRFVIWLCPFLGDIVQDGKKFEEFDEYLTCKKNIEAIIYFPKIFPAETFGRDFSYLLSNNITFSEALQMNEIQLDNDIELQSPYGFDIAVLQRISMTKHKIYNLLDASGVFV